MDAAKELHTAADIEALPEGQRMELIDGVLYDMASPNREHQQIISGLTTDLNIYVRSNGGGCKVYPAPFAVRLNADDYTYVEPDVSVICDPSKLDERGCAGAPDFIAEVVSPSSTKRDYMIKLFKYRSAGVREYWIINPETRTIQTYWFEGSEEYMDANQYAFDKPVPLHIWKGLDIRIADYLE